MIAALILVVSVTALVHFALSYWRALMLGVAAQPLSENLCRLTAGASDAEDFAVHVCYRKMCPDLRTARTGIGAVRLYYRALKGMRGALGRMVPRVREWTNREMAACARYVAVVTDQQLHRNLDFAAQIYSR